MTLDAVFAVVAGTPETLGRQIRESAIGQDVEQVTLICRARTAEQICCLVTVHAEGDPPAVARGIGGSVFGYRSAIAVYATPTGFTCATRAAGVLSDFGCSCQP